MVVQREVYFRVHPGRLHAHDPRFEPGFQKNSPLHASSFQADGQKPSQLGHRFLLTKPVPVGRTCLQSKPRPEGLLPIPVSEFQPQVVLDGMAWIADALQVRPFDGRAQAVGKGSGETGPHNASK